MSLSLHCDICKRCEVSSSRSILGVQMSPRDWFQWGTYENCSLLSIALKWKYMHMFIVGVVCLVVLFNTITTPFQTA